VFSGSTYVSPIQYRCHKNYVIIITDGMSTNDTGVPSGGNNGAGYNLYTSTSYINSKRLIDYTGLDKATDCNLDTSGNPVSVREINSEHGSHMLDDVAYFLYNQDLKIGGNDLAGGDYDEDGDNKTQNVVTYAIGFMTGSGSSTLSEIDQLLTATAEKGGGLFYQANKAEELQLALTDAVNHIMIVNSQYVSPVVPVNRVNRTYAGNGIYLGLFLPDESGLWKGNLKKFGFSSSGIVLTRDLGPADANGDGTIDNAAHSAWYPVSGDEGMKVDVGGLGQVLIDSDYQSTRTFKTFDPGSTGNSLLDFDTTHITPANLGFADTETDKRDDLIKFVTATDIYSPGTTDKHRTWVLGDIIHSQPETRPITPMSSLRVPMTVSCTAWRMSIPTTTLQT